MDRAAEIHQKRKNRDAGQITAMTRPTMVLSVLFIILGKQNWLNRPLRITLFSIFQLHHRHHYRLVAHHAASVTFTYGVLQEDDISSPEVAHLAIAGLPLDHPG